MIDFGFIPWCEEMVEEIMADYGYPKDRKEARPERKPIETFPQAQSVVPAKVA